MKRQRSICNIPYGKDWNVHRNKHRKCDMVPWGLLSILNLNSILHIQTWWTIIILSLDTRYSSSLMTLVYITLTFLCTNLVVGACYFILYQLRQTKYLLSDGRVWSNHIICNPDECFCILIDTYRFNYVFVFLFVLK